MTSSSSSKASWAWRTATSSGSERTTHFKALYKSSKTSLRTWGRKTRSGLTRTKHRGCRVFSSDVFIFGTSSVHGTNGTNSSVSTQDHTDSFVLEIQSETLAFPVSTNWGCIAFRCHRDQMLFTLKQLRSTAHRFFCHLESQNRHGFIWKKS